MVMRIIACPAPSGGCTPATCLALALQEDNCFTNNACWCETDDAKKGAWGELLRMLEQGCDDDVGSRKTVTYARVHSVINKLLRAVKETSTPPTWLTCPAAALHSNKNNEEVNKKRPAGGDAHHDEAMKSKKVARRGC